ncbi:hypothetical protein [Mesorhizobium sp. M4B.F.Ca.ET.058.02.1.1]|uniref:hypothetical protein n=1 Tax=Mesorhizobium sp. M4B.F.Ca.ET.058.02.1.1 TaxID=2493675 RepID=UPI000F751A43|nr:hypothetical protein [Mesorhizobium sp. M4B.F.Ca.ET.058.02.1.1]AZO48086.1 hypothetical protein EJ073_09845 [Mesorhizobium sp. M4B.F.Ca.ET.058.02.1.1]
MDIQTLIDKTAAGNRETYELTKENFEALLARAVELQNQLKQTPTPAVAIPETTRDLEAAGLEAACKAMCKPSGLSAWQNNMPYAEAAIRAYLASSSAAPSGEAEPVGETADLIERLQDWMREPDFSDEFSVEDITDWINRRPTHIAPKLAARLTAMQAEVEACQRKSEAYLKSGNLAIDDVARLQAELDAAKAVIANLRMIVDVYSEARDARAEALTAATAVAVPGMVLVPREPTLEMYNAAYSWFGSSRFNFGEMYRAALAASPSAQTDGGRDGR